MFAGKVDLTFVQERHENLEVFAHVTNRGGEGQSENPFHHLLVAQPDSEREASACRGLDGQCLHCHHEWMAGVDGHDS